MKAVSSATLLLAVAWSAGCAQAPASSDAPPAAEVVGLPFERAIDPALVRDLHGKWVEFDAHFGGLIDGTSDLPAPYRDGYVRFSLIGGPSATDVNRDAVMARDRAEAPTTIVPLTAVHVRAMPVAETKLVGLKQEPEPAVLLLVDYVVPR